MKKEHKGKIVRVAVGVTAFLLLGMLGADGTGAAGDCVLPENLARFSNKSFSAEVVDIQKPGGTGINANCVTDRPTGNVVCAKQWPETDTDWKPAGRISLNPDKVAQRKDLVKVAQDFCAKIGW